MRLATNKIRPTVVRAVCPWDELIHYGWLTLKMSGAADLATDNVEQIILLGCRSATKENALSTARFTYEGDKDVDCIVCLARDIREKQHVD